MIYFVVSDIHGNCTALKRDLRKAGFRKTNPEHMLVIAGDVFDRGHEPLELYNYLKGIKNKILIKGNHEQLYMELLNQDFPYGRDYSNGTLRTFCDIAEVDYNLLDPRWYQIRIMFDELPEDTDIIECIRPYWNIVKERVQNHPITKWIKSSEWVNYLEIDKYIIVHSFIPTKIKKESLKKARNLKSHDREYLLKESDFEYRTDWRNASQQEWDDAMWNSPLLQYQLEQFKPETEKGKVLVCGHWCCRDFNLELKGIRDRKHRDEMFFSKDIIALDSTSCESNFINVLKIDGDKCYDRKNKLLN